MHNVTAVIFNGRKTAQKTLDTLVDESTLAEGAWVDDVAVLSRGKLGYVRINSTWAQSDEGVAGSIGFGALTGGLVGALMGPAGAVASAIGAGAVAGGALSGLVGAGVDIAVADPRLEEFAEKLKDDTSALVLVADEGPTSDFRSYLEPLQGEIINTELNEHDVKALREVLKAERKR